jgi:hypothetical protein
MAGCVNIWAMWSAESYRLTQVGDAASVHLSFDSATGKSP